MTFQSDKLATPRASRTRSLASRSRQPFMIGHQDIQGFRLGTETRGKEAQAQVFIFCVISFRN